MKKFILVSELMWEPCVGTSILVEKCSIKNRRWKLGSSENAVKAVITRVGDRRVYFEVVS